MWLVLAASSASRHNGLAAERISGPLGLSFGRVDLWQGNWRPPPPGPPPTHMGRGERTHMAGLAAGPRMERLSGDQPSGLSITLSRGDMDCVACPEYEDRPGNSNDSQENPELPTPDSIRRWMALHEPPPEREKKTDETAGAVR
ncbi:unnamed protein product [Boreogadus saida]